MIINDTALLIDNPIANMMTEKCYENGVSYGLSEIGYDIRIKQQVRFLPNASGGRVDIWEDDKHIKHVGGNFCIASAIEEFHMPSGLAGIVHDKSTWARKGLSVFNTVIEPGWRGFLTLELVYHGREPLVIPAGSGIAQVVFHRVLHPVRYDGKYQDQPNQPVEAILV